LVKCPKPYRPNEQNATFRGTGAFDYAKGVLENYLRYYLKERGTIAYRGLEMAQSVSVYYVY
jgi:hypothetical protein